MLVSAGFNFLRQECGCAFASRNLKTHLHLNIGRFPAFNYRKYFKPFLLQNKDVKCARFGLFLIYLQFCRKIQYVLDLSSGLDYCKCQSRKQKRNEKCFTLTKVSFDFVKVIASRPFWLGSKCSICSCQLNI